MSRIGCLERDRRGARVVEEARLEIVCALTRTRGFESLPLRHLASRTLRMENPSTANLAAQMDVWNMIRYV